MRKQREGKFTQLLPLIESILMPLRTKQQLQPFVSEQRLTLAIIDRTPPIYVVSDFKHSIQAVKSKNVIESVHPSSTASTKFYSVIENSWIALNAKNQDLAEPSQYPHPYEPYFHFPDNYDQYRREKRNMQYKLQCQVIQVRQWSLKIVNISKTGYYGVVMELLDYRPTGEKIKENAANIYASLYEYSIKEKLQILRLNDLKSMNAKLVDKRTPFSLFYYCRNTNLNPVMRKKIIPIVHADTNQQMLKFNNRRQYSLVPFGQMEGLNCLQYQLTAEEVDRQKGNQIKLEEFKLFFNAIKPKTGKKDQEGNPVQPGVLWSSEDQEQELSSPELAVVPRNEEDPSRSQEKDSQSDSQDSQDDPLKNLYQKQFENMKIV